MPYSGKLNVDFRCVITALENHDRYPLVVIMENNGSKITQLSFRDGSELLVDKKRCLK